MKEKIKIAEYPARQDYSFRIGLAFEPIMTIGGDSRLPGIPETSKQTFISG